MLGGAQFVKNEVRIKTTGPMYRIFLDGDQERAFMEAYSYVKDPLADIGKIVKTTAQYIIEEWQ